MLRDFRATAGIEGCQRTQHAVAAGQRTEQQDGAINDGQQAEAFTEFLYAERLCGQCSEAAQIDARHENQNAPKRQRHLAGQYARHHPDRKAEHHEAKGIFHGDHPRACFGQKLALRGADEQ